jgi:hypothetical protein
LIQDQAPIRSDAAIAKAIEVLGITDPERQRRVIVRPVADAQSDRSKSSGSK